MRSTLPIAILAFAVCLSHVACAGTWYVNGSAAEYGDGTSPDKPLETIQEGIDAASSGDTVIVAQWTYVENIQFKGKNIVLTSTDPSDPTVVGNTVINGGSARPVVTFDGTEDPTCVLSGFTIRNGYAPLGGGIYGARLAGTGTHARIENNIITSNRASQWGGGLAFCDGVIQNNIISGNSAWACAGLYICDGIVQNNIISRNQAGGWGGGMSLCGGIIRNSTIAGNSGGSIGGGGLVGCDAIIENCIIWGNSGPGEQIMASAQPSHCCIDQDPQFVDFAGGDYHLSETSPCIGSGANQDWMWDAVDLDGNPRVIGAKVDIGAYEYQTPTDTTPPYVSGRDPAPGATRVLLIANIVLHVKDQGSGVDQTSIAMTVKGLEVTPTITGTPADYTVSYDPPSDFSYDEEVAVTVDAADLTSPANVMPRLTYSFTTIREPSPIATWYVDGSVSASGDGASWDTAFKTIQDGIDAANDGDTVVVAEGTYAENIAFRGRNIALRSTDPLDPAVVATTVIRGSGGGPVVTFAGTEDWSCFLSGFTVRNGSAAHGGGICGGTVLEHTHATIEHNVVTANSASSGGGMSWCGGTIRDNIVSSNSASLFGGGLSGCEALIERNSISGNSAPNGGGLSGCDGIILNNLIFNNSGSNWVGGLGWCQGTIRNNLIVGNWASGAANEGEGGGLAACDHVVENNTIVGNSAGAYGGGVAYCVGTLRNNIIWGNSAGSSPQVYYWAQPMCATYCCIQGWSGGEGNTDADPLFVDVDGPDNNPSTYEDNDYRPGTGSPCIDKGMNEDWMADAVALNGGPRIMDFIVDMGAYEVRELVPPEIILVGGNMALECGTPYEEPGYSATDNYDGDITAKVIVSGWVDHTFPGIKALNYNVKDSSGNPAQPKTRYVTVKDTTPPVITLLGDNPMTIQLGTPYVEPGYTAIDTCGGDVTGWVLVSGSVNSDAVGTYLLNYMVIDLSLNLAQVTRTVNVVEAPPFRVVEIVQPTPEGGIRLTWNSSPGATYTVWSCSDLLAGAWTEEATVPSADDTTTWTDPDTSSVRKFYRIELK